PLVQCQASTNGCVIRVTTDETGAVVASAPRWMAPIAPWDPSRNESVRSVSEAASSRPITARRRRCRFLPISTRRRRSERAVYASGVNSALAGALSRRLQPRPGVRWCRHRTGAHVENKRPLVILAIILGIVFIVIGITYFALPAKSLPFPNFLGHESGSNHHHVKHGIAAVLVGIACFVYAWFASGPKDSQTTT